MGLVTEWIMSVPSLAAAQERMKLFGERYEKLEAENDELKSERTTLRGEVATLKNEVAELQGRLAHHELIEDYERRGGADYKKDAQGKFTDGPRCPECKRLMSRIAAALRCPHCNYEVAILPGASVAVRRPRPGPYGY